MQEMMMVLATGEKIPTMTIDSQEIFILWH